MNRPTLKLSPIALSLALISNLAIVSTSHAEFFETGPVKIYHLSKSVSSQRDYTYLSGTTARYFWDEINPSDGVYNFDIIDRLLANAEPLGQTVVLGIFNSNTPTFVANGASQTWLYTDQNSNHDTFGQTFKRPVPWDAYNLRKWQEFMTALANHEAPYRGVPTRLADHPVFEKLIVGVPGLGFLREIGFEISDLPGFSRDALSGAAVEALGAVRDNFPTKPVYVGMWPMTDSIRDPSLDKVVRDAIFAAFDGSPKMRIGAFQENLAASRSSPGSSQVVCLPSGNFGDVLREEAARTYVGLESLDSWNAQFRTQTGDKLANAEATDGVTCGYVNFNVHHFQFYTADIDDSSLFSEYERLIAAYSTPASTNNSTATNTPPTGTTPASPEPAPAPSPTGTCLGQPATIVAASDAVRIDGTSGNDVIVGNDLDNLIVGAGGNDLICGGGGNDDLRGGSGDDMLSGGPGDDILRGGSGMDVLNGDDGRDTIDGGRNNDRIDGGAGNDTVTGGSGTDNCANAESATSCEN